MTASDGAPDAGRRTILAMALLFGVSFSIAAASDRIFPFSRFPMYSYARFPACRAVALDERMDIVRIPERRHVEAFSSHVFRRQFYADSPAPCDDLRDSHRISGRPEALGLACINTAREAEQSVTSLVRVFRVCHERP